MEQRRRRFRLLRAVAIAAVLAPAAALATTYPSPTFDTVTLQSWIQLGTWTTGTRPGTPAAGECGFNTTTPAFECWNGSAWQQSGAYTNGTGIGLTGNTFSNTGVLSFDTRTGAVTLTSGDVTGALTFTPENAANKGVASGYAPLNSSTWVPFANLAPSLGTAAFAFDFIGPAAGWLTQIQKITLTFPVTCPANLSGGTDLVTEGDSGTTATSSNAFAVSYVHSGSGTSVGNVTFSSSGRTPALPTSTSFSLVAGDSLLVTSPGSADATLADVSITIPCART